MKAGASLLAAAALSLTLLPGCSAPELHSAAERGGSQPQSLADYREAAPGRPGGVLRVSAAADTGTLDLHSISHTNAQWLGRLIYDNLVYLDDQGNISPWLARSWSISPDGRTYTFHLRDDVTFSDGTRFDAEAVLVNLDHMRDPATKSPLAAAYIAPYLSGRAIDRFTFEATLKEPYAPFLNVLAQSWLAMMSPRAIRENPKGLATRPVGSGPFVVEHYTRQQGIRLRRRADYDWAPDFIGHRGPAYVERVDIDFVPEALIRYSALASGQYDLTIDAPPQNAADIRRDPALILDNRVRTGIASRALSFNVEKAPFDDVRVRQALALSVDRSGIARSNGFGEFTPKSDFLASNTRYHDPAAAVARPQDLAQANRLLDQAGWTCRDAQGYRTKAGRRLAAEVLLTESATLSSVIVAAQSDFRRVGFDLRIVQLTLPQLTQRRIANEYQALAGGVWHTNTPGALYIIYDSAEIASPARLGQNVSRLRDAQLDAWLSAARHTQDADAQRGYYAQAQARLIDLAPAIPLFENHTITARRRALKGVVFDTSHNTPILTTAWLDRAS